MFNTLNMMAELNSSELENGIHAGVHIPIKRNFNLSVFGIASSQALNKGNYKSP
jgi:hypothetical protein